MLTISDVTNDNSVGNNSYVDTYVFTSYSSVLCLKRIQAEFK